MARAKRTITGMTVGEALRAECLRRDVKEGDAARTYLDVSPQTMSNWIRGKERVNREKVAEVAAFLRVPRDELRQWIERDNPTIDQRISRLEEAVHEMTETLAELVDSLAARRRRA